LTTAFARILGALWAGPVVGSPAVPPVVRVLAAGLLAWSLRGLLPAGPGDPAALAGELVFGLAAGFAARLALDALSVSGGVWDLQSGFGVASLADPVTGSGAPLLGTFMQVAAVGVFCAAGGLDAFLAGLLGSFAAVPPGGAVPEAAAAAVLRVSFAFASLVAGLVVPVAGALLLCDLALAVAGRLAPQLNVFSVGFGVRLLFGLLVLGALLPGLLGWWAGEAVGWVAGAFRGGG